ncbi:ankyrin repeat domain-containing protein [bacterium]|nr:ankyrin repeat domain-containing protein [bacterium]
MRRTLFLLFISFSAVVQAHPLVGAAGRGDAAAVRCMIESGVCTEVRNNVGVTALQVAVYNGRLDVVEYLLKSGADINAVDNSGWNAFHVAILENRAPILNALLKDPRLDVNAPDSHGDTPLMKFAQSGNAEMVSRLLKIGANVGDVDRYGQTALDLSTDATVQKLLKGRGGS